MARRLLALVAAAALAGCAGIEPPGGGTDRAAIDLPAMRTFGAPRPLPPQRANAEMARDFLDLSFRLESGAPLAVLSRFEEPVTVALSGRPTPILEHELDRLIERLRREARIDIARTDDATGASITVEAILRDDLRRLVPQAACFVLPARISWDEFRRSPRRRDLNWQDLVTRRAATVFVPADTSPQEVRDCLHEEIAQALGPLNDLWRLEDSVFNDDNLNSVLTGFDMLMLRATYDPSLQSGMTRQQVAERLPAILSRLNPSGAAPPARPYRPTPRAWSRAIETALGGGRLTPLRRRAAGNAVEIAQARGWEDVRLGLALFTAGRLTSGRDGAAALDAFVQAGAIYDSREATQIHAAHVAMQIAAFALAAGHPEAAISLVDRYAPAAERGENAALLADLLFVKAAALGSLGEADAAAGILRESLAWGRYGFRSSDELRRRMAEIGGLAAPPGTAGGAS